MDFLSCIYLFEEYGSFYWVWEYKIYYHLAKEINSNCFLEVSQKETAFIK